MSDIIDRLRDASGLCLDGGYLCRQAADLIDAERALADDLAEGLRHYQLHFGDSCPCGGDCPLPALLRVAWDREATGQ